MDRVVIGRSDIALLAKVRRPLVSMWPERGARAGVPFPAPLPDAGPPDLFDGAQVVDWLETTGLGKNPRARADLVAFGVLADTPRTDPVVLAGLTALLCLLVTAGELPTDHDELLDLADTADPDDEYLFGEVEALGERREPLARYAALLADAAYHPAAAFETLLEADTRTVDGPRRRTALSAPARRLAASAALALGGDLADPVYVDLSPGGSDLLVDVADVAGERGAVVAAVPPADGPAGRLALRRLRVHDVVRRPLRSDGHGGWTLPRDAVVLLALPAPDRPDAPDVEILRAVDDLVLGSATDVRAVVVGPSSALTDRLRDRDAATTRGDLLRTDRVRAVVRLPAGLRPSRSRSRTGLWCLGPPQDGEPVAVAGDLVDETLDPTTTAELVTDLVAGVRGGRALAAHAFRFVRPLPARVLRARTGDLVERPARPARRPATADLLARVAATVERLGPVPATAPTVTAAPEGRPVETVTTLGAALEAREVRVLPGLRLRAEHVVPDGAVRLLGPDELAGSRPGRRADRLVLADAYPDHVLTRPDDVVFCTGPRPMALVDRDGGAVVTYPAKVLRCVDARLVPAVLAADIAAQPATARAWKGWTVRRVPADRAPAVAAVLDDLARQRDATADRLNALTALAIALADGAVSGVLDLDPTV